MDIYSTLSAVKISLSRELEVVQGPKGWRYKWQNTAWHTTYAGPFATQAEAENAFRERVIAEALDALQ